MITEEPKQKQIKLTWKNPRTGHSFTQTIFSGEKIPEMPGKKLIKIERAKSP